MDDGLFLSLEKLLFRSGEWLVDAYHLDAFMSQSMGRNLPNFERKYISEIVNSNWIYLKLDSSFWHSRLRDFLRCFFVPFIGCSSNRSMLPLIAEL